MQSPNVTQDVAQSPLTKATTFPGTKLTFKAEYATPCLAKARKEYVVLQNQISPLHGRIATRHLRQRRVERRRTEIWNKLEQDYKRIEPMLAEMRKEEEKQHRETWNKEVRRRRRPSELWSLPFSFTTPSKRPKCHRTPAISPRGSILTSPPTPQNAPTRPRVDSSGSPVQANMLDMKDINSDTLLELIDLLPSLVPSTAAPHPGDPVDFTSPRPSGVAVFDTPLPRRCSDAREYHAFLEDARRNSSPTRRLCFASDFDHVESDTKTEGEGKHGHLNKQSRILGLTSNVSSPIPPRACTLDRSSRPLSASKSVSTTSSTKTRTSSDGSDASADAFLRHVRASTQKRMKARKDGGDDVFVDEREKGWLGGDDTPL